MSDQEELDYLRTEVDRLRKLYLEAAEERDNSRAINGQLSKDIGKVAAERNQARLWCAEAKVWIDRLVHPDREPMTVRSYFKAQGWDTVGLDD